MKAIKKNFWLKLALGTLFLVVFLTPASIQIENSIVSLKTNTAYAEIEKLVILPVGPTSITPDGISLAIEVTGQPGADEKISLILKTKWSNINTWPIPESLIDKNVSSQTITLPFKYNFDKDTVYYITVFKPDNSVISNTVKFKGDGSAIDNNGGPAGTTSAGQNPIPQKPDLFFGCYYLAPFLTPIKCATKFVFEIIFTPISYLTTLAAKFLDFFVYYSISSDPYRSTFVEKAWSVVRDISNMFFIIALLYVAIKTILGMNVSDNKRIIGMIVLIALLINFSLFVSRVVIDASNILARVFYNNITPYDENGNAIPPESNKPKSVSVGLVKTFEPQRVISDPSVNTGQFFIVTVICIILLVYMILMFISISMLFLGRVAGLWMSMMFAPLAFTSLAMPKPFNIPRFGFNEWKNDLLKVAFMAPVYAFFIYIIILFGGFLGAIQVDSANTASDLTGWLDALMKNIIPFMLIFALLKEAKSIAKDYAGKMGQTFSDIGASVGGLALGAATGGLALAGRATAGRAGSWLARNTSKDTLGGRVANRLGRRMGTGSWDARNVKVFGKGLSDTGLKNLNTVSTPKAGGWEKIREDKKQKRFKRAEEVSKVGYGERVSVNLRRAELDLHTLMEGNEEKLASLEKNVEEARKNLRDATASNDTGKINMYTRQIQAFRAHQVAIKKGEKINMGYNDLDDKGAVVTKNIKEDYGNLKVKDGANRGKTIVQLQTEVLPEAKKAVRDTIKKRKLAYADRLSMRFWSDGAQEVVQKVRAGATYENKTA